MIKLRKIQSGIAIIMAMLIVALATSVAAFAAWQQNLWMRQAESLSSQAMALAASRTALTLGREALAEDARNNQVDHLNEPWAKYALITPADGGGTVTGKIADQQGLFNVNNLAATDPIQQALALQWFEALLTALDLPKPTALVEALRDYIDQDDQGPFEDLNYLGKAEPYRTANAPLQSIAELSRVEGFDADVMKKLRPFITAIPVFGRLVPGLIIPPIATTPINMNTAPVEVLNAVFGASAGAAIGSLRDTKFFSDAADFDARTASLLPPVDANKPAQHPWGFAGGTTGVGNIDTKSDYFLVSAVSQFERTQFGLLALIKREAVGTNPPTNVVWQQQTLD
ncbi:MAG: type II secretion system minor pseudopilin GspK [Burkholderiales bacterium]